MKPDHQAKLIIHDADKMTTADQREILAWLRDAADFIKKNKGNLARRFTARLMK